MKCRSDAFENPVIQQHYRNLEALALDMMAPEDTEDLISKIQTKTLILVLHFPLLTELFLVLFCFVFSDTFFLSLHLCISAKGGTD